MVILFDMFNLPQNVFEVIFATSQQQIVAGLLVRELKRNSNQMNKHQMSEFATRLHEGKVQAVIEGQKIPLSYNKRQFYDRILTPMKSMGLIEYDLYRKTYKLSPNFSDALKEISQIWLTELNTQLKNPP